MAITVQILEPTDVLQPTDWVRPLAPSSDTDHVDSFSTYGGSPINHLKWVQAKDVFGEGWMGHTLKDIDKDMRDVGGFNYEVARGAVPPKHIWNWKKDKKALGLG